MKCQALFSRRKKKMSSATILNIALYIFVNKPNIFIHFKFVVNGRLVQL